MSTTTASRTAFFACKRVVDVTASASALVLLAPLLLLVAAAVKLGSPGPVLFRQERMGKGSRPFLMSKFRTMVTDAHRYGPLVTTAGDARVTPLGRFLRTTKLDELPQLWHVLVGDMSLVGPRPQTRQYFELYRDEYSKVLDVVRPGITDFAAICYRNEEAVLAQLGGEPEEAYIRWVIPAKLRLYRLYVERMSIRTDLHILLHTVRVLLAPGRSPEALGSSVGLEILPLNRLSRAGHLGPDAT
jgi:lipopolysaccharide/colanic/teichoic acid biosynthesis glycosyltransferase